MMKENIEIQQEFENLVTELEKLRTVNQLTSTNEETARKVVNRIEQLVSNATSLQTQVQTDFNLKSELLGKTLDELPKMLLVNSGNIVEEIKETERHHIDVVLTEYKNKIDSLSTELSQQIDYNKRNREKIKTIINSEIDHYRQILDPINTELEGKANQLKQQIEEINVLNGHLANYLKQMEDLNLRGKMDMLETKLDEITSFIREGNKTTLNFIEEKGERVITHADNTANNLLSQIAILTSFQKQNAKKHLTFSVITWALLIVFGSLIIIFQTFNS